MEKMKIIIPHEGVNEISEGYKPLMTTDGKLVSIVPENMTKNDVNWLKSERCIPVVDWEQRRYELAKAAMQGSLGCCNYLRDVNNNVLWAERYDNSQLATQSVSIADEVIKQLKEIANHQ